eukprot:TRINITY_DN14079_c0_g1_i1.p1 TRINITY_DN14079_c0_g1~~TRINITY_DN14079_c0_g1_i1.p1  ORF type:complete len:522 (+),score=88.92 TRINITY_DN14079_c0_g1_i1:14-1579(+)
MGSLHAKPFFNPTPPAPNKPTVGGEAWGDHHPPLTKGKKITMVFEASEATHVNVYGTAQRGEGAAVSWEENSSVSSIISNTLLNFGGRRSTLGDENDDDGASLISLGVRKTGDKATFMTLVKAFVGPAHLYLAKGFANGGVIVSVIALFLCCMGNAYCVGLLIDTKKKLNIANFAELGEAIYGKPAKILVDISLVGSQLGLVTMYFIFVSGSMKDAIAQLSDCDDWATGIPLSAMIGVQVLLQLPLSWLRNIKNISFFAILADVFILSAMWYVISSNIYATAAHPSQRSTPSVLESKFPMFFGTAVLTFEGIGLMLPIHGEMRNQERFIPLLWAAMMLCCTLFAVFAFVGYVARGGNDVNTNLLLAMPEDENMNQLAKIFYSTAVTLTFPLQAFPAYQIIERWLNVPPEATWTINGLRSLTVTALGGIALLGSSNLGNFVSLIGGVTMCPLAFVFPALFHFKAVAETPRQKAIDLAIASFGVCFILLTTGMTIYEWVTGSSDDFTICDTTPLEYVVPSDPL